MKEMDEKRMEGGRLSRLKYGVCRFTSPDIAYNRQSRKKSSEV